jgi:antitoxin (DNA-binding transcriptional repressor) of toxin-antitoxin stability system
MAIASRAGSGTFPAMESHISAAEAAQTFPEVIERVRSHGEVFVVEQAGEPICRIAPMGPAACTVRDLVRLLQTAPRPDDAYLDAVEEIANDQSTLPETPWER